MAFTENMQTRSYVAGSDLSAKQFRFVSLAADGAVDATGAGAAAAGVLLNNPDSAGEAVDATTDDVILGYALETGADGQVITIELARGNTLAL
jgi:hypothetical protein